MHQVRSPSGSRREKFGSTCGIEDESEKTRECPRTVLIFAPQCPIPTRSGAHLRVLSIVETFLEMGWSVGLTGEPDAIDGNWTEAGIKRLEGLGAVRVVLPGTRLIDKAMSKASAYLVRRLRAGKHFSNGNRCPTYLRSHFGRLNREIKPQLVFVNYATYAGVVDELPGCTPRILEIHDLISVNKKQRELLAQHQDSGRPNRDALEENFYTQHLVISEFFGLHASDSKHIPA